LTSYVKKPTTATADNVMIFDSNKNAVDYIGKKIAEGNSEITIAELLSILNSTYEPVENQDMSKHS